MPCEARTFLRSKIGLDNATDQLEIEIDRPKVLKKARRCLSVRKLLFPFARAPAKCGRNGPPMQVHWGIRVRQTPKFCKSAARLDGLVNLRFGDRTTEPEKSAVNPLGSVLNA